MTDPLSKAHRSWIMSRVRSQHTKPERLVRSLLHRLGYRFTVNGPKNKKLPGRPDIVLPGRRTVLFVHGCFWHRHTGCKTATTPKTNTAYWQAKFTRNVARDRENQKALAAAGWHVLVIWECQLKDLEAVAANIISQLPRHPEIDLPESLEDQQLVAETQSSYQKRPRSK